MGSLALNGWFASGRLMHIKRSALMRAQTATFDWEE